MELVEIAEMGSTKGRLVTKRQFIDHSREFIQFQTVKKSHSKENDENTRRILEVFRNRDGLKPRMMRDRIALCYLITKFSDIINDDEEEDGSVKSD